ncbi:MAG: PIN domain-containing protein [Myxococcales bacterium]|nr:PIN domain-containing protein [Myxococcales bacterium]
MNYLLDTTILLEVLRASPSQRLVRRLAQVPTSERFTSAITVSQILLAARRQHDTRLMQDVIRLVAAIRVAPYDLAAAQSFAKLRATVAGDCETDDVMIAAIALSRGYLFVTRRHELFARFTDLHIEDWMAT